MTIKELQKLLKKYPDNIKITLDTPYDWYDIKKVYLETSDNFGLEIIIEAEE